MNELIEVRADRKGTELNLSTTNQLVELEQTIKRLVDVRDELKVRILEEMQVKDIKMLENDNLILTRIDESARETFDSKKLRADNPDLYDEYVRISKVKPSLRIKIKEEK